MISFRLAATQAFALQFVGAFVFEDVTYPAGSWLIFGAHFSRFACLDEDARRLFVQGEAA